MEGLEVREQLLEGNHGVETHDAHDYWVEATWEAMLPFLIYLKSCYDKRNENYFMQY